jgi:adhesin transport system membrane fusion protein
MLDISNNKINDELAEYQLYSLKTLRTPELTKYLARVLIVLGLVIFIGFFLPWQQNVRGQGKVTALNPANRPQTVESAIPGRIIKWHIIEGNYVEKGDTILQLAEVKDKYFDPQLLQRTQQQIEAKENSLLAKELKMGAYQGQIVALKESLDAKMRQARNKINQSILKLQSDSIAYESEKISFDNMANIFTRNKLRYESGNITMTKFQELESKYNDQRAKIVSAENKYAQSKAELSIVRTDLSAIQADYSEKINKANTDLQATYSEINETQGGIAKMRNEYSNIEVRIQQYSVLAPQTGYIVKTLKAGLGETIKEGEALVTIMPDNPDLAVEMYVRAMDIPLLERGRLVRIEFDGWPALQFSGWPSVAVGTFGGTVEVIDRVNNGSGNFRILVRPDPNDDPWPPQLRLGSGTKGWVMLDNVPVWYEIWRQLNGFPASLYAEPN